VVRMFSGLAAPVLGAAAAMFKGKDGRVSAYRIVLVVTLAAAGWAVWSGSAQWAISGGGIASGGFGTVAVFLARWLPLSWLIGVLLWPLCDDKDDLGGVFTVLFFVALLGTALQAAVVHGAFDTPERTHYRATVSCSHCGASCYVNVELGESWTDWEHIGCCKCGIRNPVENVPEYAESRKAWESRVAGGEE